MLPTEIRPLKLSVIVPVLNEAMMIEPQLRALQWVRTTGVAELILVDGGSTDATAVRALPWVDRLVTSVPGRGLQMNAGARQARGEVLLFLHLDTDLPVTAPLLMDGLDASGWGRFDVRIRGRHSMLPVVAAMMNLRSRLTGIATGDQAVFVHRALFERVGGFPEQPLMEDIELSKRLKRISRPRCLRAKVMTSGRRWDQHGLWRTIRLMWSLRFDYWRGVSPAVLAQRYGYTEASQAQAVKPVQSATGRPPTIGSGH
ncbi:rSAM/selenodomain-associated transferase 2 [Marinobacterium halophilum]|uniref:RSAM/selenodomain-associated transferase 2 n=1 Tax=Marinobacterium halophilum TaxID=267374 RepID=A0A2P8F4S4_9GAMM|nr:TIGR04283 family arsenosugar biosynthesis glycosyltransferase [Marinobacterium halophilum]PSL16723.1 rSAM/selenodomain-associated transferase 2 [Marinobacterium halophilum]